MLIQKLDLNGISMRQALDPPLRKLSFADEDACKVHICILRKAWRRFPPKQVWETACAKPEGPARLEAQRNACIEFMRIFFNDLRDEDEDVFRINKDKKETHSEWRKSIYYRWTNLWIDVSAFLDNIHPIMGHWHGPDLRMAEPMPYGELIIMHEDCGDQAQWMHWHKNILLAPTFFDNDIKIRVHRQPVSGEGPLERYLYAGTWTKDMSWDVWYVHAEIELRFEVIDLREGGRKRTGTAAVFVFARLCQNYRTMNSTEAAAALLKYASRSPELDVG